MNLVYDRLEKPIEISATVPEGVARTFEDDRALLAEGSGCPGSDSR
jgi:hypothetical protein